MEFNWAMIYNMWSLICWDSVLFSIQIISKVLDQDQTFNSFIQTLSITLLSPLHFIWSLRERLKILKVCLLLESIYKFCFCIRIYDLKGSLRVTIKLLLCDPVVLDSSCGNKPLQCRVKLHTIDLFSGLRINGSFMQRTVLY